MSKAKISAFGKPAAAVKSPDEWVNEPTLDVREIKEVAKAQPKPEPMKRFTLDVSESLHKRIKGQCAARGVKMADTLRELLEQEFPKDAA